MFEQIGFLLRSADLYDEGHEIESKNMATKLRVILHDTNGPSTSVLKHLNKKDILFYDTAWDIDPLNIAPQTTLISPIMVFGENEVCRYLPNFDNAAPAKKVSFDNWWNKIIIKDVRGNTFTRKELVICICNQDGGAHVDNKLKEKYADFTRNNSLGISFSLPNSSGPIQGAEFASIRQMTYELLKSLRDEFPDLIKEEDIKNSIPSEKLETKNHKLNFDDEKEINETSLRNYLNSADIIRYWVKCIQSLGIEVSIIGLLHRDIEMIDFAGITSFNELNSLLEKSKGWGEKYLDTHYQKVCGDTNRDSWSTDLNGVIGSFLIANYLDIFTDEILEERFGYGSPEKYTVPAKENNPKFQKN